MFSVPDPGEVPSSSSLSAKPAAAPSLRTREVDFQWASAAASPGDRSWAAPTDGVRLAPVGCGVESDGQDVIRFWIESAGVEP